MKHICEYGCGQEAKFQFKNGKWCCSKSCQNCPIMREKNGKNQRTKYEEIVRRFKKEGCKVLTTLEEYENGYPQKLKYICSRGHLCLSRYDGPKTGITCKECSIIARIGKYSSEETKKKQSEAQRTPFEDIIKFVESEDYNLLSKKEDYKNQFSILWFRCPKGHEFPMRYDNFKGGCRCPDCARKRGGEKTSERMKSSGGDYVRSFIKNPSGPQVELFNLVKEIYPGTELEYSCLKYRIDIAIPGLKIAIEYDGSYWHQDQEYDDKRQKEIEDQGWTFLRYRDYVPSKEELERDISQLNFKTIKD